MHSGTKLQKSAKKYIIKKVVKLPDHANVYKSFTNFEYEVNEMTGNENYVNLLKLAWNHEIMSGKPIFGGFKIFRTIVRLGIGNTSPTIFSM